MPPGDDSLIFDADICAYLTLAVIVGFWWILQHMAFSSDFDKYLVLRRSCRLDCVGVCLDRGGC